MRLSKDKDMLRLREGDQTKVQRDKGRGLLHDFSLKHRVEVCWDINEEGKRDQMFILRIDKKEVILDAEEVLRLLRWV